MADGSQPSDRTLLDKYVRDGREEAFTCLVRRHQAMAWATAKRISLDSADAQDAMQRALVVLARRAGEMGKVTSVGAWLHRVVTLEALSIRRQRLKRSARERMAMEHHNIESEGRTLAVTVSPELDQSINALGAEDRDVLVMHYLEGQTFRNIADARGGTAEAWQKRSVRALEKLAGKLRRRGVVASATALGAFLVSSRSEAGIASGMFNGMTRNALGQAASGGGIGSGSSFTATVIKMKTGLILGFLGGAAIPVAFEESGLVLNPVPVVSENTVRLPQTKLPRNQRVSAGFSLDIVQAAIRSYDEQPDRDSLTESRLRGLMFTVPSEFFQPVRMLLTSTSNPDRFGSVAASFFARWAEVDAPSAWRQALETRVFKDEARRGVVITWLNIRPDDALTTLLEERHPSDIDLLEEFLRGKVQHAPREAAHFVDRLAETWQDADRRLFPLVARMWANSEPLSAGDWVESYWDPAVRNSLLKEMAVRVARTRGYDGLNLANRVDGEEMRREARLQAIRWWGVSSGGLSFAPNPERPGNYLGDGFPPDWTPDEIRRFSMGAMVNYARNYQNLLAIARNEAEIQFINEGVIWGSGFSDPSLVCHAVEAVSDAFARSPDGKEKLRTFIRRWREYDPVSADAWLRSQPAGPKADAMRIDGKGDERK